MLKVRNYPLVSDQVDYAEVSVIVRELERVLAHDVVGDVVELGCYSGTTSLFIQRTLQENADARTFHVYDSFDGLPPKVSQDMSPAGEQFVAGELHASKQQLIKHFKHANLSLPVIHKCWFEELTSVDMPNTISFAFLDGDFYTSIKSSLAVITPHLTSGAVIIVDDYQSEALPGARRAVDEWTKQHKLESRLEQSLAIIQWKS